MEAGEWSGTMDDASCHSLQSISLSLSLSLLECKFLHKLHVYKPPARPFIFAHCIETGGPFRENMIIMHAARMGDSRGAYRVLEGKPEGMRPLERPWRRCENNIKMALRPCAHRAASE
jgi:hypothetical protein